MKIDSTPHSPVTDEASKRAARKSLKEWFYELDRIDALAKGRREIVNYLYGLKEDW